MPDRRILAAISRQDVYVRARVVDLAMMVQAVQPVVAAQLDELARNPFLYDNQAARDGGFLVSQDYVSPDYFAADYVGVARSF